MPMQPSRERPSDDAPFGLPLEALSFQSDLAITWRSGGNEALEAARLGFLGLAALLSAEPPREAFDGLCLAARRLAGADAAWLLVPERGGWDVLGCSLAPESRDAAPAPHETRLAPLRSDGWLVGAVSYWSPRATASHAALLAVALEEAIASALATRRQIDESEARSMRDPLTGLLNRRALDDTLGVLIALARRTGRPVSVLMLDLDHFKIVNDTHGHESGDAVLRAFAGALVEGLRHSDLAFRYGGEEFLVALPETSLEAAASVAEKLRERAEALVVSVEGGTVRPTVSIGAAALRQDDDHESLIARADRALYRAKAEGRNRVAVSED